MIPVVCVLDADQFRDIFARDGEDQLKVDDGGERTLGGEVAVMNDGL